MRNLEGRAFGLCAAAIVLLSAVSVSSADIMTFNGTGMNVVMTLHAPGHLTDGQNLYTGQLLINYKGHDFATYCVDIDHYAATTPVVEANIRLMFPHGDKVAYLYETYAKTINNPESAAALQAAIWEAAFETSGTYNVNSGSVYLTGDSNVLGQATTFLASLPASYTPHGTIVLDSANNQDMLVPEPATMSLLALGGVALLRRRRRVQA